MSDAPERRALILQAGEGRRHALGKFTAIFKADEQETDSRYSVSEWWMDPGFMGVGEHSHDANDEIFIVLEGTPTVLLGKTWTTFEAGAFIRIPAGMTHDFRNQSGSRCGLLNLFIPGGFERNMPAIVDWFDTNPGTDERR